MMSDTYGRFILRMRMRMRMRMTLPDVLVWWRWWLVALAVTAALGLIWLVTVKSVLPGLQISPGLLQLHISPDHLLLSQVALS